MSDLLLIPIHVDALYAGSKSPSLVAPLANFLTAPYTCWVTENRGRHGKFTTPVTFNPNTPFTSQVVMRKPANLANFGADYISASTGIHLHWSLPDALTVMRADPDSNNHLRFPQVPNRWLITIKTRSNADWTVDSQWIVESDYLYPEAATAGGVTQHHTAITFPIVPLDHYRKVLTKPPPSTPQAPGEITDPAYDAVYAAPFRYMGRAQKLSEWKGNDLKTDEHLYQHMSDGLTAVGYGDPLFAAIYPNCFSVFGFLDAGANNTQARRYDVLGWYENTVDCLQLFASLASQKPNTKLYDALVSEYKWKAKNPATDFPTVSLYYASVDVEPNLKVNPALAGATPVASGPPKLPNLNVAVGSTGTEALSADLAATLADGDVKNRLIMEDQLEAIGLRHELGDSTIDLDARFNAARHSKGFQPRSGGTLWSIQWRSTSTSSNTETQPSLDQPPLPSQLAHVLNELNLRQAEYDDAWQNIETLRHRVFADWLKFTNAFNFNTGNATMIYTDPQDVPVERQKPENQAPTWKNLKAGNISPREIIGNQDEILPYLRAGSLKELQQLGARAGLIEIDKDAAGKLSFSATSASDNPYVATQFTLAQGVLLQMKELTTLVDHHNAKPEMTQAQRELVILRKAAPSFWQPSEPAVLLKGNAVPSTLRHGEDGRANDDETLTCQVLSVATLLDAGGISSQLRTGDPNKVVQSIQTTIESLRPQTVTPDTIGFSQQTEEPWHPISLEWEVKVWPEAKGMAARQLTGSDYQPSFVGANYEFDENASELLLTDQPSLFKKAESENIYTGRTTLTSGAADQLEFNLEQYLMGLTLWDLKSAIVSAGNVSDEVDYQVDRNLIDWAKLHFTLTDIPALKDPAVITGPDKQEQITAQQNTVAAWYRTQHIFRVAVTTTGPKGQTITKYRLIDLDDPQHFPAGWYNAKPALMGSVMVIMFGALPVADQVKDPLNTALRAYKTLSSTNVLAQSLGGLNNAFLMRAQTPQLPIFDLTAMNAAIQPAGSVNLSAQKYKDLTRDVAAAVAGGNDSSPFTHTDFLPIRSGLLQVNKLYLVDTFGQVLDVSPATILPSDTLTISRNVTSGVQITAEQDAGFVYLAPRVTQPARLNFRWLAATPGTLNSPDEPEMNDHPETSPVCGWLIPNHLDGSLMFYDAQGGSLGSILQTGVWEPAPATVNRIRLNAIENPHLRRLANYLTTFSQQHNGYWANFLTALDSALENIDPANFGQHEALALLIGRPIAVVRASLSLQLLGKPALNQTWYATLSDMYEGMLDSRISNEFPNVNFPVRLGEHRQLNDGLIGYWIENETGYQDDKFYSSQAEATNDPNIVTHHREAITQNVTLTTAPLKLTMLMDPRGEVHATSGVLPTKQIGIPSDHYAGILKSLSVTFMTAPVLTDQGGIRLNLPQESGYSWSWFERPSPSVLRQIDQIAATEKTLKFTTQRLVGGWLKLTPEDTKS